MTDSIYNNAGMPSEQGAAPEIPEERGHDGLTQAERLQELTRPVPRDWKDAQIAALTLERDTLKAELESVKHGSGWWEVTPAGQKKRCSVNEEEELRIACEEVAALKAERDEFERKGQELCSAYGLSLITIHDLEAKVERLSAPVSDAENFHFEDDEVLGAVNGSDYISWRVRNMLSGHTSGEKWSLYRAIAKLALAARASAPPTPLVFTCPFDGEVWRFHTQEQLDKLWKHLEWHANREQKLASEEQQREKDAGWDDRFIARCGCGRTIAWYSGEYLHISDHSKACPSK